MLYDSLARRDLLITVALWTALAVASVVVLTSVDTVAMLPVEPTMQAAYARARGFFAQQGIDAKLTVLSDPTQIAAAILSGDAQFASFSIGGLATLKARGFPVRLVASGALYRRHYPNTAIVAGP